jgi:hypothetical protein
VPLFPERGKTRGIARPLFLERDHVAARDVRTGFVDVRLRQCDIVVLAVLVVRDFGNAVVDQLAHSLDDRSEIAGCNPKRGMNGYKSPRETRFYFQHGGCHTTALIFQKCCY